MINSKLEKFSDNMLKSYLTYVSKLLDIKKYRTITELDNAVAFTRIARHLAVPFGGKLHRLDMEYLFYLFYHNHNFGGEIKRPQLFDMKVTYVTVEKSSITLSGNPRKKPIYDISKYINTFDTYIPTLISSEYLDHLKEMGDIDPITDSNCWKDSTTTVYSPKFGTDNYAMYWLY